MLVVRFTRGETAESKSLTCAFLRGYATGAQPRPKKQQSFMLESLAYSCIAKLRLYSAENGRFQVNGALARGREKRERWIESFLTPGTFAEDERGSNC